MHAACHVSGTLVRHVTKIEELFMSQVVVVSVGVGSYAEDIPILPTHVNVDLHIIFDVER